jgi:DNA invertase Pin-like site-specific DNA recombinase
MKRYIAYYRVSTDKQGRSGLGLDAQRQTVAEFVKGRGDIAAEFVEIESTRNKRPELAKALEACRREKAALLIARLDRLARNVAFISNLMESKVDFVAADMPDANRLTIHIIAAVAEYEREMISSRTKDALKAAKERGVKLGNPDLRAAAVKAAAAIQERKRLFHASVAPLITEMHRKGWTLYGIAKELNQRKIPTARGGWWHPATVSNILKEAATV